MSNARNIASGSKFVDTAGDTMTGRLNISGASVNYATSPILQFNTTGTNTDNRNWAIGAVDDHYGNFHIFRSQSQSDSDPVDAAGRSLTITKDGHVKKPNQPSFTAHRNVDQDIYQSSTNVNLVFDTVDHNIGNHYSTTTGKFTCPVDGVYFISFSIRLDFLGSTYAWCYPFVNGSPRYDSGAPNFITQDTGSYTTLAAAGQLSLNANDYVQIYAYVSGDSDWDFENASNFSMRLMG